MSAAGDERFYAFVDSGRNGLVEHERLTFRELDEGALAVAHWLTVMGATDSAVLLLYPAGLDFLVTFLGCLYARVIAVPSPLPSTEPRALERAVGIIKDADVRLVLTDDATAPLLHDWLRAEGLDTRVQCTVLGERHGRKNLAAEAANAVDLPVIAGTTTAYLQYTSGSTSEPRGVVLTHDNLLHNSAEIRSVIGAPDNATGASWLPHYHDMGLIGMQLQPLFSRANLVFCSPVSFVMRPVLWLQMISQYGVGFTAGPNFAFDWLLRNVKDDALDGLDLSSLRWVLNGAEPVRSATLRKMSERFGSLGLRPDVWSPGYGLAECTLLVTGTPVGRGATIRHFDRSALEAHHAIPVPDDQGDLESVELVASGSPVTLDVRIVDAQTCQALPDREVGEIWVRGGSVTQGYWQRSISGSFDAALRDGAGGFFRTDDLGFLLDGELFVTGRLGELIISNGRNIYPQDVEESARDADPAVGAGAAFSVDTGREELVLVQELRQQQLGDRSPAELARSLKAHLTRTFAVQAVTVVLVDRGNVGRTTSGKTQRRLTRERFLAGQLEVVHAELTAGMRHLLAARAASRPDEGSP
jgi:acyl-CoA synthetase (AMP-forming)/AMP-acid ligase II